MSEARKKLLMVALENERRIIKLEEMVHKYLEMNVVLPTELKRSISECRLTAENIILLLEGME